MIETKRNFLTAEKMEEVISTVESGKTVTHSMIFELGLTEKGILNFSNFLSKRGYGPVLVQGRKVFKKLDKN